MGIRNKAQPKFAFDDDDPVVFQRFGVRHDATGEVRFALYSALYAPS
jgi:hypothetical protein